MNRWLLMALGALLLTCIGLGVWTYSRGVVIDQQAVQLDLKDKKIDKLSGDNEQLSKQLKLADEATSNAIKEKNKILKELPATKSGLKDTLKGNGCDNVPLPDATKRMLEDLYRN